MSASVLYRRFFDVLKMFYVFCRKLEHQNIVRLQAVTLTSDPTCIILVSGQVTVT